MHVAKSVINYTLISINAHMFVKIYLSNLKILAK